MAYIDGEFVFVPGYGSGLGGLPYDSKSPQGQVYGLLGYKSVPFWCRNPESRKLTLLRYMERRVGISKEQTGSYEERFLVVSRKLAEIRARKFEANQKRRNDPAFTKVRYVKRGKRKKKVPLVSVYDSYSAWLEVTKEFPTFLEKIVNDYFPTTDEAIHWDIGQIAYHSGGGSENKSLVREILIRVDKIGQALFPEPEPEETEQAQALTEEPNAAPQKDDSFFNNYFDSEEPF